MDAPGLSLAPYLAQKGQAEVRRADHADLSEGTLAVYRKPDGTFIVEGTKIDKMLGYTNLDSEKGFVFFQKFLRDQGINKMLKDQGIEEGDTVWVGDLAFEYYDS